MPNTNFQGPRQATYVAVESEGGSEGVPYTGSGRQGDTRGAGREATNGSKHGFTRADMARSTKQRCDGSRKQS